MGLVSRMGSQQRALATGMAVPAGDQISIEHGMTRQLLSADNAYVEQTAFGPETEVCAHRMTSNNRVSRITKEFGGVATGSHAARGECDQNVWEIQTSSDPATAIDNRDL